MQKNHKNQQRLNLSLFEQKVQILSNARPKISKLPVQAWKFAQRFLHLQEKDADQGRSDFYVIFTTSLCAL